MDSPWPVASQWLRGLQKPAGSLQALIRGSKHFISGAECLAVGVVAVRGEFERGRSCFSLESGTGVVGQGLCAIVRPMFRSIAGLKFRAGCPSAGTTPVAVLWFHRNDLVAFLNRGSKDQGSKFEAVFEYFVRIQ